MLASLAGLIVSLPANGGRFSYGLISERYKRLTQEKHYESHYSTTDMLYEPDNAC